MTEHVSQTLVLLQFEARCLLLMHRKHKLCRLTSSRRSQEGKSFIRSARWESGLSTRRVLVLDFGAFRRAPVSEAGASVSVRLIEAMVS